MKTTALVFSSTLLAVVGVYAAIRLERSAFERSLEKNKAEMSRTVAREIVSETIGMAAREVGLPQAAPAQESAATGAGVANSPLSILSTVGEFVRTASTVRKEVVDHVWGISVQDQVRIGRECHERRLANLEIADNPALLARLQGMAEKFAKFSRLEGMTYTVTLVADDEFGACSSMGGYIYVNTGLVDKCDSDSELAFVLGHEVAHIELGHGASAYNQWRLSASIGQKLGGDLGQTIATMAEDQYQSLVAISYSQDEEYSSDEWSYVHMRRMGYSRDEALAGVKRLVEVARQEGRVKPNGSSPAAAAIAEALTRHFRSHPYSEDRLKRLAALAEPSAG